MVPKLVGAIALQLVFFSPAIAQIPAQSRQVVVAIAPDWDSRHATLQCYARKSADAPWKPAFKEGWPVLLGSKGLAWGRGEFTVPRHTSIPMKVEHDGRAPAGVFEIGRVFGNASEPPAHTSLTYVQVGPNDAWVDDPKLPHYNQYVRFDPAHLPPWFPSQRMRLGDNAYKWLVEIRHNANPPSPGFGSAIFFHVRRGPDRPTAGCTTMALDDLEVLIRWLKPDKDPVYVLLPQAEYRKYKAEWGLP